MKKGFTLVELLAVIVILSLLMAIAIPSTMAISAKIKLRLLNDKLTYAEKAAVLWGQDHKNCFANTCSEPGLNNCSVAGDIKTCTITLEKLAEDDYQKYDEGSNIINPADKALVLNDCKIELKYNKRNQTFSASVLREKNSITCD